MTQEYQIPPRPEIPERDQPIAVGETAPDFTLPGVGTDATPFDFTLSEFMGGQRGLLVFYQDDGMPICTSELKAIAQEFDLINEAGVRTAAINTNGVGSHQRFQERDAFPFPLISEPSGDGRKTIFLSMLR